MSRKRTVIVTLLALAVIAFIWWLPGTLADSLQQGVEMARGAGLRGALVYGLVYAVLVICLVPGSLLTLAAGSLYGPFWGTLLVSPASVLGATGAFLIGRFLARERVARRVAGDARFAAMDAAIGDRGFRLVALMRLSPLFPFTVLNYALGLTQMRLRDYVLASFLGMLPGTFMYVYLGSLVSEAGQLFSGERPDGGGWTTALYVGGLLATVAVTVMVTRIARQALSGHLKEAKTTAPTEP